MLENISLNLSKLVNKITKQKNKQAFNSAAHNPNYTAIQSRNIYALSPINTTMSPSDKSKYLYLLDFLKNTAPSKNSEGLNPSRQLDILLKNGKLLAKSNDDKTTTLDNLYDIASSERAANLDSKRIITDTLDILINPRYVTQQKRSS